MANLSDYHVIDGVTEVLAEHHNTVLDSTIRAELSNIETLAANRTLIDDDFALQVFTPTAARDVLLPAVAVTNHPFYIINASATYALSVKNAGGTLIGTISVSGSGQFSSDGAAWFITSMPYVLPSTSGNVLTSDGSAWVSATPTVLATGTYTPTLTNTTNIAASTAYPAQWFRVGNIVTVSGQLAIDPTTTGDTLLGISIPVASNFTQLYQLGGTANPYSSYEGAAIYADTTNDRATLRFTAVATANTNWWYTYSYQVL